MTKVNYRPYTPQSEIAVLYFQEEELEELECDRETVSGDQFECQFDEMALAVHIAYQQINPSDEWWRKDKMLKWITMQIEVKSEFVIS